MKKVFTVLASASALLALVSCAKEIETPESNVTGETTTFTISLDATKVAVASDGKTSWEAGDVIAVSDGYSTENVTLAAGSINGSVAEITTTIPPGASSYYACYPASRFDSVKDGKIVLKDAEKQDGDGAVCVSICHSDVYSFPFKNVFALLSFSATADATEVAIEGGKGETVDYESYEIDPATGAVSVTSGPRTSVKAAFKSGETCYVALPEVSMTTGFTITFFKGSEMVAKATTANALSAARNKLINMGDISSKVLPAVTDLYADYNAGKPIEIAGKTYTKAVYGEPVLVKATSAKFDVRATLLNGGIVFLEEAEESSFGFSNWVNVTKPLVVISRYASKPVTLVYESGTYICHNNAQRTVFKNVNFDFSARNNYAFNSNINTAGDFHFDGCKFKAYAGKGLYYSQNDVASGNTSTQRHPASVRIMNCYVELPNATSARTDFFSLGNTNNFQGGDIKEVIYDNNIFYATGSHLNAGIALLAYGNVLKTNDATYPNVELNPEITLTNNTFYGVLGSNCYFQVTRPSKVTLKNNIFWAPASATLNSFVVKFGVAPAADPVVEVANNIAFGKGVALFHTSGKFKLASGNNATLVTEDPLAGAKPSSGDFTPIPAYKDCGAQR